jgi:hypothetical protein
MQRRLYFWHWAHCQYNIQLHHFLGRYGSSQLLHEGCIQQIRKHVKGYHRHLLDEVESGRCRAEAVPWCRVSAGNPCHSYHHQHWIVICSCSSRSRAQAFQQMLQYAIRHLVWPLAQIGNWEQMITFWLAFCRRREIHKSNTSQAKIFNEIHHILKTL